MEYINFNVAVPIFVYLELESMAFNKKVTKNEIITALILSSKTALCKRLKSK